MKKLLVTVVALIVIGVTAFIIFMSGGKSVISGYSLRCDNDIYMIIEENGAPIRYNFSKAVGTNVENLEQGDKIIIISDVVNESYPGSTRAYVVMKIADGDIEDIPEDTLASLEELGWYKAEE